MSELFRNPPPGITAAGKVEVQKPLEEMSPAELDAFEADLQQKLQLKEGLPFLYGWPWYKWAKKFVESRNREGTYLCAANQISKSSTQIRKCIIWATDQNLWPELWVRKPTQFWYLYPTQKQVNAEFETKWKLFLPTGAYKDDPYYGYTVEKYRGDILAIHFHSGVHVYFKTYMQNAAALQSGTCDAIFCDEELPENLHPELQFRLTATNGYFHMVFTATLGQEYWRKTMEPEEGEVENFPGAQKQTVSLYDSMIYEDGRPSQWTLQRIKEIEARCPTQSEVLKRVYGKFISIGGRVYESFDIKRHMKPKHPVNKNWLIYAGIDLGGGLGDDGKGHSPAIVFLAVKPDFRSGRFIAAWCGDDGADYTDGDVYEKYVSLVKENKFQMTAAFYDFAAKDFEIIATRNSTPVQKAEKDHAIGEGALNTLFKNDMLAIYVDEELQKLGGEFASLKKKTNKRHAKDNRADAARYAAAKVPWDWTAITGAEVEDLDTPEKPMNDMERQIAERRKTFDDANTREQERIDEEFEEANYLSGNSEF